MATESTDRSTHPTVVEYAVQTMIKRGYGPAAAAKDTVKRLSGYENIFFGPGVTTIEPLALESALWQRLADFTIHSIQKIKPGFEHYALDGTINHFHQRPSVRSKLKDAVIDKLGSDPFPSEP
jgi:hypothetical protein